MSENAARLPPLDENVLVSADADTRRRERYLRKLLAEGGMHPARRNLVEFELRELTSKCEGKR